VGEINLLGGKGELGGQWVVLSPRLPTQTTKENNFARTGGSRKAFGEKREREKSPGGEPSGVK